MRSLVWLFLVIVAVGAAFLFFRGPGGLAGSGPPAYGAESRRLHEALFSPLEDEAPISAHELVTFAGRCRRRAAAGEADAATAELCVKLVNRLLAVHQVREKLSAEVRQYSKAPPSSLRQETAALTLDPKREDERIRRQQFMISQVVAHKWLPYVQKARPPCDALLAGIVANEKDFAPGGVWGWVQSFFVTLQRGVEKLQAMLFGGSARTAPAGGTAPAASACAACSGAGFVTCPDCAGFGSRESAAAGPCAHCKGTGQYRKRLGDGLVPCTFCRGTGQSVARQRIACSSCQGTGKIPCAACSGKGTR